jgi:hypothetical protein
VTEAPVDGESWEEIGWIALDSATVAFGAASVLGEDFRVEPEAGIGDGSPRGYEAVLVLQNTREDGEYPVEVLRGDDRTIEAARMCFVTDVDGLEGTWREIGRLEMPDGQCVACDPFCSGPVYRFVFKAKPGSYVAEAFDFGYPERGNDVLGLRIRLEQPTPEQSRTRAVVDPCAGQAFREASAKGAPSVRLDERSAKPWL